MKNFYYIEMRKYLKTAHAKCWNLRFRHFFLGEKYYVRSTYVTSISAKHSSISALDATSLYESLYETNNSVTPRSDSKAGHVGKSNSKTVPPPREPPLSIKERPFGSDVPFSVFRLVLSGRTEWYIPSLNVNFIHSIHFI